MGESRVSSIASSIVLAPCSDEQFPQFLHIVILK
jgi:hypothetical protein